VIVGDRPPLPDLFSNTAVAAIVGMVLTWLMDGMEWDIAEVVVDTWVEEARWWLTPDS
jgi:hypothetical protein